MTTWNTYQTVAPTASGYEVNRGFIVNGILYLVPDYGGVEVSKIYDIDENIYYVQRSVVADKIVNGFYDPSYTPVSSEPSMDFSDSMNSGYVAVLYSI